MDLGSITIKSDSFAPRGGIEIATVELLVSFYGQPHGVWSLPRSRF